MKFAFLATTFLLTLHADTNPYADLISVLHLTDAQWEQIKQRNFSVLDSAQRTKLDEVKAVLDHSETAAFAVVFGLIAPNQWPAGCLCPQGFPAELELTQAQAQELDRIRHFEELKTRRDTALSVLDDAQRAKLDTFQTLLRAARQAIDIHLLAAPSKGECLCH